MTKKKFNHFIHLTTISIGVCSLTLSHAFADAEVLRIGNYVKHKDEFEKEYNEVAHFLQNRVPPKKVFLTDVAKRQIAIQKAKAKGLDKDPQVIEKYESILFATLVNLELGPEFEKIHITDAQAEAYYKNNPEIRTSHIFVAAPHNASAADQKKAYDKIKKIHDEHFANGKSAAFSQVAQEFSEEKSELPTGGDIGYRTRETIDPAYYEAALKLKEVGKVSGIVRSQLGYHIIKLTGIRTWEDPLLEKQKVKLVMFEQERAKLFEKWMANLWEEAKPNMTIHTELLKD